MPSPVAHTAIAYIIWRAFTLRAPATLWRSPFRIPLLLLATSILCLLPDLPSIVGVLTGQFGRYHNSWEHSLITGVLVAVFCGAVASLRSYRRSLRWFLIALLCYESHVLMDYATIGRGVMLFWPFTDDRLAAPVRIFFGLHWSDGWLTWKHLVTLITEMVFAGFVIYISHRWRRKEHTLK